MEPQFNPNSYDSVLSNILTKLENQDKNFEKKVEEDREAFKQMMLKQDKTNGQVQAHQKWIDNMNGRLLALGTVTTVVSGIIGVIIANWDKIFK